MLATLWCCYCIAGYMRFHDESPASLKASSIKYLRPEESPSWRICMWSTMDKDVLHYATLPKAHHRCEAGLGKPLDPTKNSSPFKNKAKSRGMGLSQDLQGLPRQSFRAHWSEWEGDTDRQSDRKITSRIGWFSNWSSQWGGRKNRMGKGLLSGDLVPKWTGSHNSGSGSWFGSGWICWWSQVWLQLQQKNWVSAATKLKCLVEGCRRVAGLPTTAVNVATVLTNCCFIQVVPFFDGLHEEGTPILLRCAIRYFKPLVLFNAWLVMMLVVSKSLNILAQILLLFPSVGMK